MRVGASAYYDSEFHRLLYGPKIAPSYPRLDCLVLRELKACPHQSLIQRIEDVGVCLVPSLLLGESGLI